MPEKQFKQYANDDIDNDLFSQHSSIDDDAISVDEDYFIFDTKLARGK